MKTLALEKKGACVGTKMGGEQPLPICRTTNLNSQFNMNLHFMRLMSLVKITIVSITLTQTGHAVEFFVAPSGSDSDPGTPAKPFASFARAQEAARTARKANPDDGVTVNFNSGVYALQQPIQFTSSDSGVSAQQPVLYRAVPGAEVVVSGGKPITGWQVDPQRPGIWKTHLADAAQTNGSSWRFDQLWVNGQWAVRARTPDWWHFARLEYVTEEPGGVDNRAEKHTFKVAPEVLAALRGLGSEELHDVQVVVFHKWDTTREALLSVSPSEGLFTTSGPKMAPWNKMGSGCLFYLENWLGALDAPGEWFLDRQGWLYYRPRSGENMARAEVVAPVVGQFLSVQGDEGNRVQHLYFDGLQFSCSGLKIPDAGYVPAQAAINVEATAIQLDNVSDVVFTNCAVEHVGATGIWFRHDCQECRVEHTRLFDLGLSGVRIGETKIVPENVRTAHITLDNCIVQSGGRIRPDAAAVCIGQSGDNTVSHCDIGDFLYTGISAGWTWGYSESVAMRNRIEYNHIHHIGYGILSDMGGIYTLGNSEGTVVRNNVVHDISASTYGGWGLYADEGTAGILYENNLVYNTLDGGFHQHYGKSNVLRNNIFAFGRLGQIAITRAEPHLSFTFEHNVVCWDQGELLGSDGWNHDPKVIIQSNLYWREGGQHFDFKGKTWGQWRAAGNDTNSIIENPLFVDANKCDFRLQSGSPVAKIGFKPFDVEQAGVCGNRAWIQMATNRPFAEPPVLPPFNPVKLRDDFESGRSAPFLRVATLEQGGRHDLITVVEDPSKITNHCLKIQDDPGLKASYEPFWYCEPHYVSGQSRLAFKIQLETDAAANCEWRSSSHGDYFTGPSIEFKQGAVLVQGRRLLDIPTNTWISVEIRAPLGHHDSQWEMSITLPDGKPHEFNGLPCDRRWTEAQWIGFISPGTKKSAYYLDDLIMLNQ